MGQLEFFAWSHTNGGYVSSRSYGAREQFNGYVTTMASIAGKSFGDLERSLGFGPSSLADGFYVYALVDIIGMSDFEWKDQTAYSDGWHFDPTIGEFVQRQDELRAQLGKLNQYNEAQTDEKIRAIMMRQLAQLNVRVGPERIIKVVAKQVMNLFPPSDFRRIPQWRLRNRKSFVRLEDVPAGGSAPRF